MFGLDVNDAAVVEQSQILDQLLSTNPKTQKALQQLIHQVILEARAQVVSSIQFKNGDPHQSRRAVRSTVYKRILGGNINILNSRKAHGTQAYQYQRTLRQGQRGGNRGSIAAQPFFRSYGERALERAAEHLGTLIDSELEKILNKTK